MTLKVNPEFKSLIPPLSQEEFNQLEKNILQDGCRDPIVVWNDTIIDGHNRYEICQKHDLQFKTESYEFKDFSDAKIWMLDLAFGQRNLEDWQKYENRQAKKEELEKEGKAQQGLRTDLLSTIDKKLKKPHNTQKEIAKDLGWSTGKVAMADKVKKEAKPELIEKIKTGEITINKAYQDIKKVERKEKQLQKEQKSILNNDLNFTVTELQNVIECDALITDPPYGILNEDWDNIFDLETFTRNWLSRWNECSADIIISSWSQRYLFDGRKWFDEELTNYTFQQLLIWHYPNNKSPQSRQGFKHTFEPIYFYRRNDSTKEIGVGGGDWGDGLNDFDCHVSAMPQSNFNDENMKQHPAQKSLDVMRWLVNAASQKGDLVVDPFCGSGTTGIACKQLERDFYGIEINQGYKEIATKRIATYG